MSKVSVVIASHKPYEMPSDRSTYLPVEVGSALRTSHIEGFQRDDEGTNISWKNKSYCELTALYWAWKNSSADILGLVHYRRHFCSGRWNGMQSALQGSEIEAHLNSSDLILPKKRFYVIETLSSHYRHTHMIEPLEVCKTVVSDMSTDYSAALQKVLNQRSAHMFNMLIGNREVVDEYCSWLFEVLARVEDSVDISRYSDKERRVFGYLSELLLDAWIDVRRPRVKEVAVHHVEGEHWLAKGPIFIANKVRGTALEKLGA